MEGNPFFTEAIKTKALAAAAASKANFGSAYEAGVKIAFGTDSAVTKHGENADEFAMMVESGMTEMDAIRSATVVAAELLEMSAMLGTIEAGKLADIIAVDLNPLEDITALEDVSVVVKEGTRVK
jgi:imidazolonepropionase-like amidohydrolase